MIWTRLQKFNEIDNCIWLKILKGTKINGLSIVFVYLYIPYIINIIPKAIEFNY